MKTAGLLHVLGAGQWQLPTIRLARSLGLRVLVTDMYRERPGYAIADHHEVVDITDRESTLEVARRYAVDGIVCDTTDTGVPTAAYVAERLGLRGPGYEIALNFTDKHRMRRITTEAGVPNPLFEGVRDLQEARRVAGQFGFPVVVKPSDNQGSRGVTIVRRPEEIGAAFDEAAANSRSGLVVVETFLDGTELTVESVCVDGRVTAVGISDKDHFGHRPAVANRLTYPADVSESVAARVREVNALVIGSLGLRNGITHAEYMLVGQEPHLIEIAARGAGSYVYSHIVPHLAGDSIPARYLHYVMGGPMRFEPAPGSRAANLGFFDFPPGRVRSVAGIEEARRIPGVAELLLEFDVGDEIRPPRDDRSRPGLVVVLGSSRADVLATTDAVYRAVKVEVK